MLAKKQMVAAAHPLAVDAGLEILRQGGSAVDAAIVTQLVLTLVEPQSSGIGGGAFLLHWDAAKSGLTTYDGRETAPKTARADRFLEGGRPMDFRRARNGGRSVGVPGLMRMLELAHKAHGRLPWAALFAPAIKLAKQGFPMGRRLNLLLTRTGSKRFNVAARAYFFDASGTPRRIGRRLRNPALAKTLQTLANRGASAFYKGPLARKIIKTINGSPGAPGDMTAGDFASYSVKTRAPVCALYRANIICGMGPPSSGGITVLQTLMMLEAFNLGGAPLNPQALHLIAEAQKHAYADRNHYLADPDFVSVPSGLLDPGYIRTRRAAIELDWALTKALPGTPPGAGKDLPARDASREKPGTSHISIVDAQGNAVTMTTTIESGFGSGLMVGGFLLNNELTDFSFRPKDKQGRRTANRVEGGKRPLSSMSPTFIFDAQGKLKAALGSPGGTRIILYVTKTIVALLDWNMSAQQAAGLINFGSRNRGVFEIEAGPEADTIAAAMHARGHRVRISPMTSGTHIVVVRPEGLEGGADPRREGAARGD